MTEEFPSLVLGTAGHIDHGKSSLVMALTGVDPDRLAEEKQRGITIELGFARLKLSDGTTLGVVDVPGHERFVRQMIAGSTGIDLALLCIAADDGVMPQTVEHLAVLELLGIPSCVVALTKSDLVDDEWILFVEEEIRGRLSGTLYADSPIVAVSSKTDQGLDELKTAIAQAAQSTRRTKAGTTLRLPIDRVFTIKGSGTVVTGTLWSGEAIPGDEVEVLPSGSRTRIRGIQVHGQTVDRALAGHRVALNLNALATSDIRPGDFLVSPGAARTSDRFDADVTYLGLPGHDKPLESGVRVHVAHGTREVTGRVLLMGENSVLRPGERGMAQIRLDDPLPVMWRDRFVIRSYSPMHVIGGGTALRTHPRRTTTLSSGEHTLLEALRMGDETAVAHAVLGFTPLPLTVAEFALASELSVQSAARELTALVEKNEAVRLESGGRTPYHVLRRTLQKICSSFENTLLKFHSEHPAEPGIAKEALRQRCLPRATEPCFNAVLAHCVGQGIATVTEGVISHPKAGAGARKMEEQAAETLGAALAEAGVTPPTLSELITGSGLDVSLAYRALGLLEKQGRVRKVGQDFYFDAEALATTETAMRRRLAEAPATAAELRDAMAVSRKYAIPLLEFFDAQGITRRDGDQRMLNS